MIVFVNQLCYLLLLTSIGSDILSDNLIEIDDTNLVIHILLLYAFPFDEQKTIDY